MTRADIFDEAAEIENTDVTPEPEVTEAPAAPTADEKAAKQAAADAEHLPNVEAFKAVVLTAVENADEATGTVSQADLDAVATAYRDVSGGIKYKNLAKDFVDESMKSSLSDGEYIKAVSFNEVSEKLRVTKAAPKAAAPKVDPKEAYADRLAALQVAMDYLESNVPEDAEDYELPSTEAAYNQVVEHIAWEGTPADQREGSAPELSPIASVALKVIKGKGQGLRKAGGGGTRAPFTGTRRNVGAHIESAFADQPSGTFLTVSEIVKHTSEEYGDDHPSSGAVAARLGGNSVPAGIVAGVNAEGTKGATKQ